MSLLTAEEIKAKYGVSLAAPAEPAKVDPPANDVVRATETVLPKNRSDVEAETLDKAIVEKIVRHLFAGKTDFQITQLLEKEYDFEGGIEDLFERAHEQFSDEINEAHSEEDRAKEFAGKKSFEASKLWLENYCLRNRKRMPTDPADIELLALNLKVVEDAEKKEEQILLRLEDEALPEFPRLSGSLSDFAEALCPDIPYGFKLMAAVTHWGLMRSGMDTLESAPNLQPRFYSCFIAPPWRGKSAAINEVRTHMRALKTYSISSSIDSGPALVDEFKEVGTQLAPMQQDRALRILLDPDEMRDVFEKAKVTAQSKNSIFTEFLKLYEGNRTGNSTRGKGKIQIEDAHLAVLGGATPEGYSTMWTGTGGGSTGLQSRVTPITTNAPAMPTFPQLSDSQALGAALLRMHRQMAQPAQVIRIDEETQALLSAWGDGPVRDKTSGARVSDMAKRLLIVLAVTNDTTVVDKELASQAIRFGDYVVAVREKFNPADSYSWTQAFENDIVALFKKHPRPLTMNEARQLVHADRKPGGLTPFLQAWKNLISAGVLRQDGATGRGTARYRYQG